MDFDLELKPYVPEHAGEPEPEGSKLEPAFAKHFRAYKAQPTPSNATRLLNAVKPVIDNGVTAFGGKNANPMMRSHAKQLTLRAVSTYDPMQASFKTHLTNHLKGLQRYGARQTQMLSVPERVLLDKQRLDEGENELRERLGREPSSGELAEHTHMPLGRQAYVRKFVPGVAEGQIAAANIGSEDSEEDNDPAVAQPDNFRNRLEFIYHDLDPASQLLVEHSFGLHGRERLPASQIARRLNLSPGAISQRSAKIQGMLDELEQSGVM